MSDTRKQEKKYLNGLFIREHVFDNGGNVLKVGITKEFIDQIKQIMEESDKDNVRCVISRRKETSPTGISHFTYVDPWEPKKDYNDTNDPQYDNNNVREEFLKEAEDEELPF